MAPPKGSETMIWPPPNDATPLCQWRCMERIDFFGQFGPIKTPFGPLQTSFGLLKNIPLDPPSTTGSRFFNEHGTNIVLQYLTAGAAEAVKFGQVNLCW